MKSKPRFILVALITSICILVLFFLCRPDQITRWYDFSTVEEKNNELNVNVRAVIRGSWNEKEREGHWHVQHSESPYDLYVAIESDSNTIDSANIISIKIKTINDTIDLSRRIKTRNKKLIKSDDNIWATYFSVDSLYLKHLETQIEIKYILYKGNTYKGILEGKFEPNFKEEKSKRFIDMMMSV